MRVNARIESIFSHAAALHQSGRLKNTIYGLGSEVYIFNQDHTVLLKFNLRDAETPFAHSISFDAADYDSNELQERDGFIEFIQRDGEYVRTKSCRTPKYTAEQIAEIFYGFGKPVGDSVSLPATIKTLLNEELSHIEFSAKEGRLSIVQRNIYKGTLIKVEHDGNSGLGLTSDKLMDFGPVGLRTDDFLSLFTFSEAIVFWFEGKNVVHFRSSDPKVKMLGILSQCIYDQLGGELITGEK